MVDFINRNRIGRQACNNGTEVWFTHPTLPVIRVSNQGRVRTKSRTVKRGLYATRRVKGRIVHPCSMKSGYLTVGIPLKGSKLVHRLVLQTFVGPCPKGMQCRHLDGVKANNHLTNLCWGTPSEDQEDRRRHGTMPEGEFNYNAKLTSRDVLLIHAAYARGEISTSIAKRFGITSGGVIKIIKGRTYKNAQPDIKACIRGRGGLRGKDNGRARLLTYKGRTMILNDWAKELDISPNTLRDRLKIGGVDYALSFGRVRRKSIR